MVTLPLASTVMRLVSSARNPWTEPVVSSMRKSPGTVVGCSALATVNNPRQKKRRAMAVASILGMGGSLSPGQPVRPTGGNSVKKSLGEPPGFGKPAGGAGAGGNGSIRSMPAAHITFVQAVRPWQEGWLNYTQPRIPLHSPPIGLDLYQERAMNGFPFRKAVAHLIVLALLSTGGPAWAVLTSVPLTASGQPLANQTVTITFPDGTTQEEETDDKGILLFDFPGDGKYRISHNGVLIKTVDIGTGGGWSTGQMVAGGVVLIGGGIALGNSGGGGSSSSTPDPD